MSRIEYKSPNYDTLEFTCPNCNKLVKHETISYKIDSYSKSAFISSKDYDQKKECIWDNNKTSYIDDQPIFSSYISKIYGSLLDTKISSITFFTKICSNCGSRCYWELISKIPNEINLEKLNEVTKWDEEVKFIYPFKSSIDIQPNKDMNSEEKSLFNEAVNIFDQSPKAAGALLRSVLESILRRIFNDNHSKSLLGKILSDEKVQENLGDDIINTCMAVKLIGNEASHAALLIYKEENKKEVKLLFKLVNLIAETIISKPKEKKKLFEESNKIILNKKNKSK